MGGKEESGGGSVWGRRVEEKCVWERRRVEEGVCEWEEESGGESV